MSTERGSLRVTWLSLPRKDQLFVLCLVRFSEPVVRLSIVSYIYYQLQSLDESLSSAEIVKQAAWLQTVFMISQCVSSWFLGRLADSPRGGRKLVTMVSLLGSFITCAAFGFVRNFRQAIMLRIFEGLTNGNVAMVRTMVSEIVVEKRFQATAFVLLPLCTLLASFVAPLMAGLLAEMGLQAQGNESSNAFLKSYPYALPALMNAGFTAIVLVVAFLLLEETLKPLRTRYDPGIALSQKLLSRFPFTCARRSRKSSERHERLETVSEWDKVHDDKEQEMVAFIPKNGADADADADGSDSGDEQKSAAESIQKDRVSFLPTKHMFTTNLLLVLLVSVIQDTHISVASMAMPNFLSAPVATEAERRSWVLPFIFGGGCGFGPRAVSGWVIVFGLAGVPLQVFIYPRIAQRVRSLQLWRWAVWGFPFLWMLHPMVGIVPSTTAPPEGKDGPWVWLLIVIIQTSTAVIVTFTSPTLLLLVNSSSPHPSALGRTHSVNFFGSMAVRAAGSAMGGSLYAYGSTHNMSGLVFWLCAALSLVEIALTPLIKEGNGHEITLPGDEVD